MRERSVTVFALTPFRNTAWFKNAICDCKWNSMVREPLVTRYNNAQKKLAVETYYQNWTYTDDKASYAWWKWKVREHEGQSHDDVKQGENFLLPASDINFEQTSQWASEWVMCCSATLQHQRPSSGEGAGHHNASHTLFNDFQLFVVRSRRSIQTIANISPRLINCDELVGWTFEPTWMEKTGRSVQYSVWPGWWNGRSTPVWRYFTTTHIKAPRKKRMNTFKSNTNLHQRENHIESNFTSMPWTQLLKL